MSYAVVVISFTGQTWRAAGVTATNLYRYSLDPCRLAELLWPNIFGTSSPENAFVRTA